MDGSFRHSARMRVAFLFLVTLGRSAAIRRAPTPGQCRAAVRMQDDAGAFSMATLSSRIAEVRAQPEPHLVRLLMLEPMLPRQRLALEAPAALVDTIENSQRAGSSLVVMEPHWPSLRIWDEHKRSWKGCRQGPASHGVEVTLAEMGPRGVDGGADVTLVAGRLAEVVSIGVDEGSALLGRSGTVRWQALDPMQPEEQPTPAVLECSEALGALVSEWAYLVRTAGSKASVEQLEARLHTLGEMPAAERPSDRALWVAALINSCPSTPGLARNTPGLGDLALEVRPAALRAHAAEARVRVVQTVLKDSIERLRDRYFFF